MARGDESGKTNVKDMKYDDLKILLHQKRQEKLLKLQHRTSADQPSDEEQCLDCEIDELEQIIATKKTECRMHSKIHIVSITEYSTSDVEKKELRGKKHYVVDSLEESSDEELDDEHEDERALERSIAESDQLSSPRQESTGKRKDSTEAKQKKRDEFKKVTPKTQRPVKSKMCRNKYGSFSSLSDQEISTRIRNLSKDRDQLATARRYKDPISKKITWDEKTQREIKIRRDIRGLKQVQAQRRKKVSEVGIKTTTTEEEIAKRVQDHMEKRERELLEEYHTKCHKQEKELLIRQQQIDKEREELNAQRRQQDLKERELNKKEKRLQKLEKKFEKEDQ